MLPIDTVLVLGPLVALAVIVWGRRRGADAAAIVTWVILAGAVVMIVGLTILPLAIDETLWRTSRVRGFPTFVPLRRMFEDIAEGLSPRQARQIVGNVLLFVPFGFALPLAIARCRRVGATIVVGTAVSIGIEVLQMVLPLRDPDVDDVVFNVTGTAIGYGLYAMSARITRRALVR